MNTTTPEADRRTCDIVMKGGITSGVVYPQAITVLARRFEFRNIGGTSAGAIAAAAAAAAEYRRQFAGSDTGFERLEQLPKDLTEKPLGDGRTRLFLFFQPVVATRRIFEVLTGGLGGGGKLVKRMLGRALRHYLGSAVLGALPGVALAACRLVQIAGQSPLDLWLILSFAVTALGAIVGAVLGLGLDVIRQLPRNNYGLCTGMPDKNTVGEPLTVWLSRYLNEVAGLPTDGRPLTFGDLWGTRESDPELAPRRINLEMMTTSLTHGRPYRLPLRTDSDLRENHLFYFRKDEFLRLFPQEVVDWMESNPRPISGKTDREKTISRERRDARAREGYLPLPEPADLPVVVATRMSLSFPVLLAAVPLYSIDRSRDPDNQRLERCWFSDGGICSNFPLHFFDSPLPRRPTFSIDLTERPAGTPADQLVPEMDETNHPRGIEKWHRFDAQPMGATWNQTADKPDLARVFGFAWSIIATMQNWTDATQGRLPGFRDRIVRVPLKPDEGGLNLNMPPELIETLTQRGGQAAAQLMTHFDVPPAHATMTWDNHRWIRLRSSLAALEKMIGSIIAASKGPENRDESFRDWLVHLESLTGDEFKQAQPSYEMTKEQVRSAIATLELLEKIQAQWPADSRAAKDAPRPRPVLRARPQI